MASKWERLPKRIWVISGMPDNVEQELRDAIEQVLKSDSRKKLIVAGPGAGKTTLFRRLLEAAPGGKNDRLVLTFINNLRADLDRSLGDLAQTSTLHGYCQSLLRRHDRLRVGLSTKFECYPGLVTLVKKDWEWLKNSEAPQFVASMRHLHMSAEHQAFYFRRSNFYDAVDFDDSVYRTLLRLSEKTELLPNYELVLIDEFQDFNKMEAAVIDLLADHNSIIVAGDDDQALYSQLRGASWDHIRSRYHGGEYEVFHLPFCMRCPEVIVAAVADVIEAARSIGKLGGRIEKPFRFFEPVKGTDSRRFPKITLVRTTVQRQAANYFGKFIEQEIRKISRMEVEDANAKHEPVALIIGSKPYLRQVEQYLVEVGLISPVDEPSPDEQKEAWRILNTNVDSNLGWRLILACGKEAVAKSLVRSAEEKGVSLVEVIPPEQRDAVIRAAKGWAARSGEDTMSGEPTSAQPGMNIKLTSYEGAKGLSAQYVFLIGLHAGDLPRSVDQIKDIEICRFLVGLTRTKKKCCLMLTKHFADSFKKPSPFLSWIKSSRYDVTEVNAAYWKKA